MAEVTQIDAEWTGQAGPRGGRVRSDCWVGVSPRDSGAVEIQLESSVEPYYGDAIRALLGAGAEALGLTHGLVRMEDGGALPFALMARFEAAVRAASPETAARWIPAQDVDTSDGPERDRPRRSRLYLPGSQPKLFPNAALYGPDAVILDLEDSVAPDGKVAARILVRNALRQVDFGSSERMVRINQGALGLEDVDEIADQPVDLILIPKTETAADVEAVDQRIRAATDREILLMPIVESALGIRNADAIAAASDRNVALTIGLEDYTADLGVARTDEGRESLWARSQVVNAARAAGIVAIDSVYSDVADAAGLRTSVEEARSLGFEGKGCIHPRQIRVIHDAFAPTPEEVEKATAIVRAFRKAQAEGLGVVSLGTKMIDPPVVARAEQTVRSAIATGRLAADWENAGSAQ